MKNKNRVTLEYTAATTKILFKKKSHHLWCYIAALIIYLRKFKYYKAQTKSNYIETSLSLYIYIYIDKKSKIAFKKKILR